MSWFSRRRPKDDRKAGEIAPPELSSGVQRSPGLALLSQELAKRPPGAILDLGSSSTETVQFLSRYCDNISIQDLFQSARPPAGARATIFRFDDGALQALPEAGEKFDLILVWDLLHYFERSECAPLIDRLAARCQPGALVFLLASAIAPIPLTPIRFKVHSVELLDYHLPSEERVASPQLRTRDVEQIMAGFSPVRLFQLRNGLQEFLFRYEGPPDAAEAPSLTEPMPPHHRARD